MDISEYQLARLSNAVDYYCQVRANLMNSQKILTSLLIEHNLPDDDERVSAIQEVVSQQENHLKEAEKEVAKQEREYKKTRVSRRRSVTK